MRYRQSTLGAKITEHLNLGLVSSLQVLLAEGNFKKAAARLNISASAMTQQIKRLEELAQFAILHRTGANVSLTKLGAEFNEHALAALAASEKAIAVGYRNTTLKVGFMNGAPITADSPLLARFKEKYPTIAIEFVQVSWAENVTPLLNREIDILYGRPPYALEYRDDLHATPILYQERVVVTARGSALAAFSHLTLAEIRDYPMLRLGEVHDDWLHFWSIDPRPDGTPVKYGPSVSNMEEALAMVSRGRFITTSTCLTAGIFRLPGIEFIPLLDAPRAQIDLVTRRDDKRQIVDVLRKLARETSLTDAAYSEQKYQLKA